MKRIFIFCALFAPFITGASTGTVYFSRDTTFSGVILLDKHVVIRPGKTLTVAPGAELRLAYGINISADSSAHIVIAGTSAQPVKLVPLREDTYWGSIHAKGTGASVSLSFVEVVGGQIKATDSATCQVTDSYLHHYNLNDNPIILTKDAVNAYIARTRVSNYYEINLIRTLSIVEDCLFEFTTADAIDFDNSPAGTIIRRTTIRYGRGTNIDAIDWGKVDFQPPGSQGRVENCLIHDFSDKGVSVGEGCLGVTITGTLIYRCGAGVAVKDSSLATICNSTFYGCEYGIEAVEKNEGLGGGHAVAFNNIIWNNGAAVFINSDGTITQSYSNVQGSADTANHILAVDPLFADAAADDFRLQALSPMIGQGVNGEDLGAVFPVGGLTEPADELSLGSPNAVSVLRADSLAEVYWSAGVSISQVDLLFSADDKATWMPVASALDASLERFTWAVPNIYSTRCYFQVRDHADTAHFSVNERPFSVEPAKVVSLKPEFSVNSGFFTTPFDLVLSAPITGATIYYTLDGSDPTDRSPVFQQLIHLESGTISTNHQEVNVTSADSAFAPYAYVRTSPFYQSGGVPVLWQRPFGDIDRQCVVRSRVYHSGYGLGPVITKSYFIHPDAFNGRWPIPVVSLTTDPDNLFDYYKGIYIPGATFTGESFTGNYCQSGSAFEYPAHIDLFDEAKRKQISQEIGIRIKGQFIRSLGQKPIGLYAKKIYDPTEDDFRYDVFPDNKKPGTGTVMQEYKRLLLRQNGEQWSTWENTMCQDALAQSLLDHCNIKTQAYRPSLVYLNGEFWGIHNIREMIDEENLSRLYDVHEDSIIIMEDNLDGFTETPFQLTHGEAGDDRSFFDLRQYLFAQNMNDSSRLAYVSERMDLDNFTDYWIATIYLGKVNSAHNQGYWRVRTPDTLTSSRLGHDGRWRWLAFDFDNAFSYVSLDNFQYAVMLVHDDILIHLFENREYVKSFVNRYCDLVNSSFKPSRIRSRIDEFQALLEPVIPYQIARWGRPMSMSRWYMGLDNFRSYADERPSHALDHIQQQFQLPARYQLTLDVSSPGAGYIQVNSLLVNESLPGVDSTVYPWEGTYFSSVPVRISAYPMPGYLFSHWLETGDTIPFMTVDTTADVRYTAVFRMDVPEVVRYIYPNPVRQGEEVHLRDQADYTVFTMDGKSVMQAKGEDRLNTSGLPAGVYVIRIQGRAADRLVVTSAGQ